MTAAIKLTRWHRAQLEQACRRRCDALKKVEYEQFKALLSAVALRRLAAQWGEAEKQADMRVCEKYGLASPVGYTTVRVYNTATRDYSATFGVDLQTDILVPDRSSYYAGQKRQQNFDCTVKQDDEDYAIVKPILDWRARIKWRDVEEPKAFAAAIRKTGSYTKIVESFPWLCEPEYQPFFASVA